MSLGEATKREIERAKKWAADEIKREEDRIEGQNSLTEDHRQAFERSEQGLIARQNVQALGDMVQSPAPDRGGFGDHDGDRFAEVPESVKPKGAPPATADGSEQPGSIPPGAPADPSAPDPSKK